MENKELVDIAKEVLRQAQYGMHCMDSHYCAFCHKPVGNLLPCNERHHRENCIVHKLYALTAKPKRSTK